jgi:hypothetical protein
MSLAPGELMFAQMTTTTPRRDMPTTIPTVAQMRALPEGSTITNVMRDGVTTDTWAKGGTYRWVRHDGLPYRDEYLHAALVARQGSTAVQPA